MNNDPSELMEFYVDSLKSDKGEWDGYYFKTPYYVDSKKKVKGIWGFSDGELVYVKHHSDFFEIFEEDGLLVFYGYGLPDMTGVGVAGVAGGAVGGAIYGIVADAKAKKVKHKYYIDLLTGKIFPSIVALEEYNSKRKTSKLIILHIKNIPVIFSDDYIRL